MNTRTKTNRLLSICPACQNLANVAKIWFSTLPAICDGCAESHINACEVREDRQPSAVERAISENEARWQHFREERAEAGLADLG